MAEPKFKVGDFVIAKAQAEAIRLAPRRRYDEPQPLIVMQVVEIRAQQCYAAIQHVYECRVGTPGSIGTQLCPFNQIELDPAPTEPIPYVDPLDKVESNFRDIKRSADELKAEVKKVQ